MVLGFGEKNAESAMSFLHLAIIARNSGRFEEAGTAIRQALASAEGQKLRMADQSVLENTTAVVDADLGNYQASLTRLRRLLAQPASDAERALQQRLIASVAAEQGDGATAVAASNEALTLLGSGSGSHSLFARQARARGLSLQGDFDVALREFDEVIQGLAAGGRPPDGFEVLRARRYRAETLLRADRDVEALSDLREIRSLHENRSPSAVELGLVLELLGEAASRAGHLQESRAAHEAARTELRRQLPEGHPYLVRNARFRRALDNNSN
jgi:tetratricopeptide (TPR) repeat protein